jgi:hypothetical protein
MATQELRGLKHSGEAFRKDCEGRARRKFILYDQEREKSSS